MTTPAHRILLAFLAVFTTVDGVAGQGRVPNTEWQPPPGFRVEIDAIGFEDPVAIASVPEPGTGSDAPRYFVAERGGRIKVVTNGGRTLVFAQAPFAKGSTDTRFELQGLALAPARGLVFVSFRSGPDDGPLDSNLARIECEPGVFAGAPKDIRTFEKIFEGNLGVARDVIGPLVVRGDRLFVGIENRGDPRNCQDVDSAGGKILRMDLDGRPIPDNPYHTADGSDTPRDYVWASGLRRPRAFAFANDVLFAIDDGLEFDRLVRGDRGSDHNFDGTKWSLGVRPEAVFGPSASIAALAFVPPVDDVAPMIEGALLFALTATDSMRTSSPIQGENAVVSLNLDPGAGGVAGAPTHFLSRVGRDADSPRALTVAEDAIYIVTASGDDAQGMVLRAAYDGGDTVGESADESPLSLIASRGCFVCHDSEVSEPPDIGRSLDAHVLTARLMKRLHSHEYVAKLDAVDRLRGSPFETYAFARNDVRETSGMARVRTWLRHKLTEPRFDDPSAEMPNHGLTNEQAARVVTELLADLPDAANLGVLDRARLVIADLVPHPRQRHLLLFLAIGCVLGGLATCVLGSIRRRLRADRPAKI